MEIETPILNKSTPEGAGDYLVPSRVHPGSFYALPQSPQIFKQLLMCSGYDSYFQIAKCFRDEDFVLTVSRNLLRLIWSSLSWMWMMLSMSMNVCWHLFKEVLGVEVQLPIQRMTWKEAMNRFGSDKPDNLRFGMELTDVSDVVKDCEFGVFKSALEKGGCVRGINANGQGHMPRKKIDALVDFAKGYGAKGLAYLVINEDGTYKSSFAKFMKAEEMEAL